MTTVPQIIVTRRGAAVFIVACYLLLVAFTAGYLALLEWAQGYDDGRNIDATVIYALGMAVPFALILRSAMRQPRLPGYPPRAPCGPPPPASSCGP